MKTIYIAIIALSLIFLGSCGQKPKNDVEKEKEGTEESHGGESDRKSVV